MPASFKLEVTVVVAALLCVCSQGMKIDFSRLTHIQPQFMPAHKRGSECTGKE